MQEAAPLLSDAHSNKSGPYYGRITRPVVTFLLAKLALNSEVYTDNDWTDGQRPTAMTEQEFWTLIEAGVPDLVLLDLGLGGSTTIGVDICRNIFKRYPGVHVLIFTGEILNEKLWVDVLEAGADGIILKTGELLTKTDVQAVMDGKKLVFNYPILEKIVERFKKSVLNDAKRQEAIISYDIDEYDERFLRHLALGYTKEMIANLRGMPFGVKSLEKRQNDLVGRLFPPSERVGVNATRLVVRALELRILNIDNLEADDE